MLNSSNTSAASQSISALCRRALCKDYDARIAYAEFSFILDNFITFIADDKYALLTFDINILKQQFREYDDFTTRTGEAVMVQEFGFNSTIAYDAALSAAEDFLSVLYEFGIPWCSWNDDFGLWVSKARVEDQQQIAGKDILRKDAVYEGLGDGWLLDTGLMEVYKRHMDN